MPRNSIRNCLENYQRARLCFVQTMFSFAEKPYTLQLLQEFDFLDLLLPLLTDRVHSIQHTALVTLGRLAAAKPLLIEILDKGVLGRVLHKFNQQSKLYKKSALHVLTELINKDNRFAALSDEDLLSIMTCLHDLDSETKVSTALALGHMMESCEMAEKLVCLGVLPELVQTLSNPDLSVKQAAAFALDAIVKHNPVLAQDAVSCNVIPLLIKAVDNDSVNVKQTALHCLADIVKHTPALATKVVDGGVISIAVAHLNHHPWGVQNNAAILLRDICKHQNPRLNNAMVEEKVLPGFVNMLNGPVDEKFLPAIVGLGYLASQSDQYAQQIIDAEGVSRLHHVLLCPTSTELLQDNAAWTLAQVGKHSPKHVASLCNDGVLLTLLSITHSDEASEGVRTKCKDVLRTVLHRCRRYEDLETIFLQDDSDELLPPVLNALAKVLPCSIEARRSFVMSQCLRKILGLAHQPVLDASLKIIYKCFPEEVLDFASPSYMENLIERTYQDSWDENGEFDALDATESRTLKRMGSPDSCSTGRVSGAGEEGSINKSNAGVSVGDVSWSESD